MIPVHSYIYVFVRSSSVGKENEIFFISLWKPLRSRRVLKTLRASTRGKIQKGSYRFVLAHMLPKKIKFLRNYPK